MKKNTNYIKKKALENNLEDNNISIMNRLKEELTRFIGYIFFAKKIYLNGVFVLHLNPFWNFNLKKQISKNMYEIVFYFSFPLFVLYTGPNLSSFKERYRLLG